MKRAILGLFLLAPAAAFAQSRSQGFHLFDAARETIWLREGGRTEAFSLGLEELPGEARAVELILPLPLATGESGAAQPAPKKYFWRAVGEVTFFNAIPFFYNRYAREADFAHVSPSTWWRNLRRGWHFDNDSFQTNEFLHAFQGSMYFNSARANGYGFWESIPFTAFGAVFWQYFLETGQVDMSDVATGTFGGTVQGEVFLRVSRMILDNTASGWSRFWREFTATVVNPAGGLVRLLNRDVKKDFPNPDDRFPSVLAFSMEGGYRHVTAGSTQVAHAGQGSMVVRLRYGDAFDGTLSKPFDVFDAVLEILQPAGMVINRLQERGLVALGEAGSSPAAQHKVGVFMNYEYINDGLQAFQEAFFSGASLSRFPLSAGTELRTEVNLGAYPLTAVQVDYQAQDLAATGRVYDYGPGFGAGTAVTLRRIGADLVRAGYRAIWTRTSSGISHHTTLQFAWVDARCPITRGLAVGAGWGWDQRITSYDENPTVKSAHTQWRLFGVFGNP